MVEVKEQYPFIDESGNEREDLILHYAEDENGKKFYMIQNETGKKYVGAIDKYPCIYTYTATDEPFEE